MPKTRLLVVEDQSIIALDLKNRLTSLGYEVVATVASGAAAIEQASATHPDLVLMDIRLKGEMDGIQAAERIRAEQDLPIIYLTAHSDEQTLQRARVTEPYGYILKPFEDRELQLAIEIARYKSQMEQKLKTHERWLAAVLRGIGDAVMATDAQGRITFLNPVAETLTGWTQTEALGQPGPLVFNAIHAHTRARVDSAISYVLEQPEKATLPEQTLLVMRDGRETPIDYNAAPMRDDRGQLTGVVLVFREALFEAGALQNAIFNSANFSSIATDEKGVIQIFNVGAERMLGYTAAEVMNHITPADISDPQEVIARAQALSVELATPITPGFEALVFKASRGIEDIYELTYIRKDGSRFPAVVSVTALRDAREGIIGYLLIGTDNTARKRIEAEQEQLGQRLRDQQFYTRSLFEANIDALMTTDPAGIITDVNKQMEALTGCTRDELIGAPFKNHFTDSERAEMSIKRVLSEKKITNYELIARNQDGRETVVSYNATIFYDRDRRLQGVFAAARDVTERNRLDQALQEKNVELEVARSVAEEASRAKSEFLSSMSHELRSPLNAILGFAQLMDFDPPPPTAVQKESLDQILQAGWHLLRLIDEILDLAKVESGQVPLSPEPVSLAEVMLECRSIVEAQAHQRDITLVFPRFDIPYIVRADRTRVKQVIINLLSNGIKYNSKQGTVEVTCAESTPGRVRVSVTDTGVGLSPEQQAQLFQSFNRLGQEAGAEQGTGIGLVLVKRLVELMGGEIGVESTVGTGSVFWFELSLAVEPDPSAAASLAAAALVKPAEQAAQPYTLLYVEDNPANLKLVEQIIARHVNIRLLTAVTGQRGIELAHAHLPDAILLDINLPDLSGFKVLAILGADPATAHIPVAAISANAMPRDIKKGLQAGFFRYITKPIKIKEFEETLDAMLEFSKKTLAKSR